MEVARRAARILTFWSVCWVRLMVTFCLDILMGSRVIRVTRIIRDVKFPPLPQEIMVKGTMSTRNGGKIAFCVDKERI